MTEPADEMHVSFTNISWRNHDGDNYLVAQRCYSDLCPEEEEMESFKEFCLQFQYLPSFPTLKIELIPEKIEITTEPTEHEILLFLSGFEKMPEDPETAITCLETARRYSHSNSSVTIPMIYRFLNSDGHNLDVKSLDPTKMTLKTYTMLVDIILLVESVRLHKLFLRAMTHCFIALKVFLGLMVESSDSKAKIQEIKAKIQDKFNYNGSCKVKIGIIPEGSGTPFLKMGVLRRAPMSRQFILHSWCCV